MSCHWVYGTLGAGKGIFCAMKMQQYLARGSRVATNMEVYPEKLSPDSKHPIVRLPDIPRIEDIIALGRGCPEGEKRLLGGLFLDETSIFLNSRSWNDKDRPKWISYIRLLRKRGWDIYFTTQDPESVDKQILKATGEEFVCCARKDHFRIPVVSDLYDIYRIFKTKGQERESKIFPHINQASYRRGKKTVGNKPYRSEMYRPQRFFGTYDTNQLFEVDYQTLNDKEVDMRASYTLLPGQILRKYEIIRNMQQTHLPEPEPQPTEQDEPQMAITLDEIELPKEKPPFPKWQLFFFLLFAALAWFILSSAFASDAEPQPDQNTTQTEQTGQNKVLVPDYLQGVYISGYVVIRSGEEITYDYAMHDRYHRAFDATYYGVTVTPAAPCLAWITTYDNVTMKISCSLAPQDAKQTDAASVLDGFDLSSMANAAIESI